MSVKFNLAGNAQAFNLDFNKAAGIEALDIRNKFIGIDTGSKGFQDLFKAYPKVQKVFTKKGYSETVSKEFKISKATVEASAVLTLARIYAKVGLLVESAGYTLGGVTINSQQAGSMDLLAFTPNTGNGIGLAAKTVSPIRGNPSLSAKLPDAYLKAKIIGDIDIGALAVDAKLTGKLGKVRDSVDLPRFGIVSGIKTKPPISVPLIDFSVPKVLEGKATGIFGKKQKRKGILESEYEGIKIASDLRNFASGLKINSDGTLSGEFSIFTLSASLNKLGAKAYPKLSLLAKRIEGKGYAVDYKLLDLSIASDLKLKYNGKVELAGQSSRATFENGQSLNLSGDANGLSSSFGVLNTTALKKVLDANGDGKAVVKFDWSYNQANFILSYGFYSNLSMVLDIGKFNVSVQAELDLGVKKYNPKRDLINIELFKKQKLSLLKDFKIIGGSKTISLPTNRYQFSKEMQFNVPTNADDLITLLGLNPADFYILKGTNSNDTLTTRTERGNDTFFGYAGTDTMRGGLGDDVYYVDNQSDVVIEEANAGNNTIISSSAYDLPDHVEILDFRSATIAVLGRGNSLNNVMYMGNNGGTLLGGEGNDTLFGGEADDTLFGNLGNNTIDGSAGNDDIYGDVGRDTLTGGTGNDVLTDISGDNILTGGQGADKFFIFDRQNIRSPGFNGRSIIKDFESSIDKIRLGTYGISLSLVRRSSTTTEDFDSETLIYQVDTGNLLYDGGIGFTPLVFATLENRPSVGAGTFEYVYVR